MWIERSGARIHLMIEPLVEISVIYGSVTTRTRTRNSKHSAEEFEWSQFERQLVCPDEPRQEVSQTLMALFGELNT